MAKSKFHAKVQAKVGVKANVKKSKSKYYDEHIATSKSSKSNSSFVIFVIVCIIIGASVSGILVANDKINDTNGNDPNDNDPVDGIKDGDFISFKYEFYVDMNHDSQFSEDEMIDNADFFEWTVSLDSEQGFPPGLYHNILGMDVGDTKYIVLPANVDADENGVDDITGEDVMSFGSGPLANTALKYFVEIWEVNPIL